MHRGGRKGEKSKASRSEGGSSSCVYVSYVGAIHVGNKALDSVLPVGLIIVNKRREDGWEGKGGETSDLRRAHHPQGRGRK